MSLFDALEDSGPQQLLPYDGSAWLHRAVLAAAAARRACEQLRDEVDWDQPELVIYGRLVTQPRLSAWYGDPGADYHYSGLQLEPKPWSPRLAELRDLCQELAGCRFNSALINLYRDGQDSVSWHSDDEPVLGRDPTIASLSLGAERRFDLRHKETRETVRVVLPAGSVLVMGGACQRCWSHQIAKTSKVTEPRINITFRAIRAAAR